VLTVVAMVTTRRLQERLAPQVRSALPRPALQAVLFDMDGTLVETEQCWGEAMFTLARRLGGRMSDEARERTVGTTVRTSMGILYADLGIRRSDEDLRADARWVEDEAARLMADGVTWRPGARELIAAVRDAGLATALVTTTPRRVADLVLARIGEIAPGIPSFDTTVCGDEVPARKPDPAPYRQAMAALGVDAAQCVVVEDSQAGVSAGLAAGAAVLAVPALQPVAPAPGLVLRDSLTGVGIQTLAGVLAGRSAVGGRG
jgi:HAD superfamily hydrolase (TIGR01509 family)